MMEINPDNQQPEQPGTSLSQMAYEDELTGLGNGRSLRARLHFLMSGESQNTLPLALFMIDMDHFKLINDRYGHVAGDKLIQHVGKILSDSVGDAGEVYRYAGDEFTLLLPGAEEKTARAMAQHVLSSLATKAFRLSKTGDPEKITLSLGVALWPSDAQDPCALIEAADRGLYRAKRQGRNRASLVRDYGTSEEHIARDEEMIRSLGSLIGRDKEIRAIEDALRGKKSTLPRALLFLAGPGMGKSSLVEEGVRRARNLGFAGAITRGYPEDGNAPYAGIKRLLEDLNLHKPLDLNELCRDLDPSCREAVLLHLQGKTIVSADTWSQTERAHTFVGLLALLGRLAAKRPLCLGLDNMESMDAATCHLCHSLLMSKDGPPILLLLSGPDPSDLEDIGALAECLNDPRISGRIHRHILNPLSPPDLIHLLEPLDLKEPDKAAEALYESSRGIPILAHHLIRKWFLKENASGIPDSPLAVLTVDEITQEALEELEPQARNLLLRASAMGETFKPEDLESFQVARNPGHIIDLLEHAKQIELVENTEDFGEESIYRFSTRDIQQTTYTELPVEDREQIHERMGQHFEERKDDLSALMRSVFHYARAGQDRKAEALKEAAVARARHLFLASEANAYLPQVKEKPEAAIQEQDLSSLGEVIRNLRVSVQNVRLFPANSPMVDDPVNLLMENLILLFRKIPQITFSVVEGQLLVNGIELPQKEGLAESAIDLSFLLTHHKIRSLSIQSNTSLVEIKSMVNALATKGGEFTKDGAFARKLQDLGVYHVLADERVYVPSTVSEASAPSLPAPKIPRQPSPDPRSRETTLQETPIERQDWQYAVHALLENGNERGLSEITGLLRENRKEVRNMLLSARPAEGTPSEAWITFLRRSWALIDKGLVDSDSILEGLTEGTLLLLRAALENEVDPRMKALRDCLPVPQEKGPLPAFEGIAPEEEIIGEDPPILDDPKGSSEMDEIQRGTESASSFQARIEELCELLNQEDMAQASESIRILGQLVEQMSGKPKPGWMDGLDLLAQRIMDHLGRDLTDGVLEDATDLCASLMHRLILVGHLDLGLRLLAFLKDLETDADTRSVKAVAARKSLRKALRGHLLPLAMADLASNDTARINAAGALLASAGSDAAEEILHFISSTQECRAKETAGQILVSMGKVGKRRFLETLSTTPSVEARRHLLGVIHLFDDQDVWLYLETLLEGEETAAIRALIHPLSRAASPRAVPLLLRLAQWDDPGVKREAIIALGRVGDPKATELLLQLLEDKGLLGGGIDETLAREACIALGRIGQPAAAESLINIMWGRTKGYLRRGWSPKVAAAAAWALGQIDTPQCHQALREAAGKSKGPVKTVAALALEQKLEDQGKKLEALS